MVVLKYIVAFTFDIVFTLFSPDCFTIDYLIRSPLRVVRHASIRFSSSLNTRSTLKTHMQDSTIHVSPFIAVSQFVRVVLEWDKFFRKKTYTDKQFFWFN